MELSPFSLVKLTKYNPLLKLLISIEVLELADIKRFSIITVPKTFRNSNLTPNEFSLFTLKLLCVGLGYKLIPESPLTNFIILMPLLQLI